MGIHKRIKRGILKPSESESILLFALATAFAGFFFGFGLNAASKLLDKISNTVSKSPLLIPPDTRANLAQTYDSVYARQMNGNGHIDNRYMSRWNIQ